MGDETLPAEPSAPSAATWKLDPEASVIPTVSPGERIGRYQVRRLLGEGGMGRVYLARDMTLGRSVAVKIVRGRALDEAQTTARFSHPHIVQLYDVGDHAGSTYLALEYLDGESLRERARREQLSLDEILRIVRAIADALVHAHAASVRHCDLKPSNVMLPRDGRVRVVDFGLSSIAGVGGTAGGTPEWMAPEQWRAEPITERVDIWALAVMVHQLLCRGAHPFGPAEDSAARRATVLDPTRPPASLDGKVPDAVADLVRRSLSRDPFGRPPATEWALVLDRVLAGQPTVPAGGEAPYRGLTAFDAASAHLFHGRDADIDALLERLRDATLLAIVGPSGAGKSSLMHAGVIPRLLARERWTVIAVRPATDPFHALASRIAEADGTPEAERAERVVVLAHELRATPTLLALRLTTIALATNTRVLLAIDQLEELFTQGISADDAAVFVAMLAKTSDEPSDPVRVVITLRDDFSGRVHGLRDVFVLRPMTSVELRRAIAQPLAHTGFKFEDEAIADDMIAELGGDANLPLLQFACRALWDARDTDKRVLSRAAYVDVGGVAGALARHADRFLAGLSGAHRTAVRTLLLRLVTSNGTRRIVERGAVLADLPDGELVLAKLVAARLVVQRRGDGDAAVYVEVVHESLLVAWGQLREWIDHTADHRQFLDELAEAETVWTRRGRADGATWTEAEVGTARLRAAQLGVTLPPATEAFLAAGERHARRRRRRARIQIAIVLAVAGIVTAGALAVAERFRTQRIQAELARDNVGTSVVELQAFTWSGSGPTTPVPAGELPDLAFTLYGPAPNDPDHPGAPLDPSLVDLSDRSVGQALRVTVEAPGGLAFLRVTGRGVGGTDCPPSWIRIRALPGYVDRDQPTRHFSLAVPTCEASRASTTRIPAGDVIYGGPGEPATRYADYVEPEIRLNVPEFRIDTTEVSNAAYKPFSGLAAITGYSPPQYPTVGPHANDATPDRPVTSIDAYQAEAFCAYMGKRLPSDVEWTKAARGGVDIDGAPNPAPRRLYPWVGPRRDECVHDDPADMFGWVAPVTALPCGASPYGVLQMAGNVWEWIAKEGQNDVGPLRTVRGGGLNSPPELEHATTVFRNTRAPNYFDFSIGMRCVEGPPLPALRSQ